MLRVGITGGIGSGKSTVSGIFESLGVPVYDADSAAKRLMNEDPRLKEQLIKEFGEKTYENGKLNRSHLSSIVFNNKEKLTLLNSLVHPITLQDAQQWMAHQKTPYSIKEAALIFESGSQVALDYVIGVSAPVNLRIQRVMERDHISRAEVTARISKQMQEQVKMSLCNFIVINDGIQMLIPQVLTLHDKLLELSKQKK
ncbi:MAG: dephospho-CoA kinase [Chitinophagaceae bacterium]